MRIRTNERGSAAVEAVIVMPIFMVVILVAIQFALWAHASHLVQEAAAQGEEAARVVGSTSQAGPEAARAFLDGSASTLLTGTAVSETSFSTEVTVRVTSYAETILPFFRMPVSATSTGPFQGFRVSG